jgi:DNA-binding NarL/FixJ family response regulator
MKPGAVESVAKVKVLLVDDHPIVRQGIRRLLEQEPDIAITGEAGDVETAFQVIRGITPDLAIVDICLPGEDGLSLIKRLRTELPDLPTIVLSMYDEGYFAIRALRAGSRGYIMKHEAAENIVKAVRTVLAGDVYVSDALRPGLTDLMNDRSGGDPANPASCLSDRELEVFQLIGHGWSTRRIADQLHLSVNTVETHRAHIRKKMDIANATELIRRAVQWVETEGSASSR